MDIGYSALKGTILQCACRPETVYCIYLEGGVKKLFDFWLLIS